ncbi:hypothetical protein O1611_g6239 [Lasiodiplodia mahajangana]|uniref:Uncharacterized protein n=1 Tax=Lasiodiplodia mahajangana TaxID=1108764 RepID=A0ACC2JJ58_9PEZI|nr:hypothetical protein O1611_g6239 [Lasiodiplodia mahajangana]
MAEGLRETSQHPDDEDREGSGERRVRVIRSLGMPEDELAAREQRRRRFLALLEEQGDTKESKDNTPQLVGESVGITTEASASTSLQGPPPAAGDGQGRKTWETLVIGNLGENLSRIERKNREIEQQRFIVKHHEKHSPHQVEHNRRILDRLIEERNEMEDNEENNMPQDQREKGERISRRLELLRWALDTSKCEDESINIRAAIRGYESGAIPYSHHYTLLYRGQIVDACPTYDSFCVDRSERLDRYSSELGPGWLWHEPPLAGPRDDALAMKGFCIDRSVRERYRVGSYHINLEFAIERDKVSRHRWRSGEKRERGITKDDYADASCQVETLLDSGATFPIILESDLARLDMDLSRYPAQGIMELTTLDNRSNHRFYEMHVSICSDEGDSLVSQGDDAVWPTERRSLGGFYPVIASEDPVGETDFTNRLSGMVPFDACYISSAPGMARFWLGEDRRDVLGTNRLPAHLRYDTDKTFLVQYPEEIEALRRAARTPDRVIFLHEYPDKPNVLLTDSDVPGTRGRSELAIGQYEVVDGGNKQKQPRKALAQRVIRVEPRKGGVKVIPKYKSRSWRKNFIKIRKDERRKRTE